MNKISIRFYKDHQVRAVWDEEHNQWWFSVVDIVAAITESPNPRKYWSVLKTRLKMERILTTNLFGNGLNLGRMIPLLLLESYQIL